MSYPQKHDFSQQVDKSQSPNSLTVRSQLECVNHGN